MKRAALIATWIAIVVTAVLLRFDGLGERPMHADEATGARIAAMRMEASGGRFDPTHYHGPLLADVTLPWCLLRGEGDWESMTPVTLRVVPAVAGCLLVLLPLACRRRFGDPATCLAGVLLATSPLLIYFSRMFIHESLLVLFGVGFLVALIQWPRCGLPGLMLGLMYATKETVAISLLAWAAAAALLVLENRRCVERGALLDACRRWWRPVAVSVAVAGLTSLAFYTHGFSHWQGAVDAVRTFFVYETVTGHDKPAWYYLHLLAWPEKSAGMWWFGTPVVGLALVAWFRSFGAAVGAGRRRWIRFLAYATVGHLVIYSVFAYKTPWLACLPWAHVCLLAGFAFAGIPRVRHWQGGAVGALAAVALVSQWQQARAANGRLHSDARNPYAYVPTRKSVVSTVGWLEKLSRLQGHDGIAVIGSDYWPLPWYLKSFEEVGYWPDVESFERSVGNPDAPRDLRRRPLVIAMPAEAEEVMAKLRGSHVLRPGNLRDEVPVQLFISNELYEQWMNPGTP